MKNNKIVLPPFLRPWPSIYLSFICCFLLLAVSGYRTGIGAADTVVVYTSVDQPFAEPIFAEFTRKTGIKVLPVFDTEAAKTVGLANRLRAEASVPKADVFWSSEFAHTIRLANEGLFAAYAPASATDLPQLYRDSANLWTCAGLRARVLIVNHKLARERWPDSVQDLLNPEWQPGEITVARPLFGTTNTHASAMYASAGEDGLRKYFTTLKMNKAAFVDGNSSTRDRVVAGSSLIGLTDSDDALVAIKRGDPVSMIFPDQGSGSGTLVIPNTVALINGAPNHDAARKFIDYITSPEGETQLILLGEGFFPIRKELGAGLEWLPEDGVTAQQVSFVAVADAVASATTVMRELFLD